MAKEKFTENPLARTSGPTRPQAPVDNSDLDQGTVSKPLGVGLRSGLVAAYDALAVELGVSRHALLAMACKYFIEQVRAGAIDPSQSITEPPVPKKKLKY